MRRGADFSRPSRSLLHRDLPLPKIPRSASRRGWILPALLAGLLVALLCPLNLSAAHKLRVTDPAAAAAIQARGGRLIADYGGFQLLEIDDAKEIARHPGAIRRDGENVIELHARRIDTSAPETRLLRGQARNFAGKRLHLVQFAGPVRPEWHAALRASGVEIVSYIPHHAYLVYGDTAALGQLQNFAKTTAQVQWEGEFKNGDKIHPRALAQAGDCFSIQLHADAAANAATLQLIDDWKRAPVLRQQRLRNFLNVIVRLPPERLAEIAARPDVVSIHPFLTPKKRDERQNQILAGNISGNGPSGPGYLAWLGGIGFTQAQFTASGFIVDVTDSGIDSGTTTPRHPGLFVNGTVASGSRVSYNRLSGSPNSGSTKKGCDGHGTLNAHIIGGYNHLSGFPHADGAGFRYGLGVAPFVKVGSSVIFDPDNYTYPNFEDLHSRSYQDGARITSNSWGSDSDGAYDLDAQAFDVLVRDAQLTGTVFAAAGNQPMVAIFCAGNAGPGGQTVGSPGTAKNVITVGAAENVQPFGGTDGSGVDDSGANNFNDIIDFSSRGPCADGRAKPDLVAPGTHISGGVAQAVSPGVNGTADACYTGDGVSGGVSPSIYFPTGQQWYTASSGTSHSTPAVAGGAALLRQFFINHGTNPPSPAMTKAWLVNSARYLTGLYANDSLPSPSQGMGQMNLGAAFDGVARLARDQLAADKFTGSGQTRVFTGQITATNQPFRITLAWTDAPGSTSGNAYNNDLDLTVVAGGRVYRGNVFNGATSVTGGAADPRNNLESVFLPAGLAGNFSVIVTAANINSDGVPNDADLLDQDFALVVYNAVSVPVPALALQSFALAAENCAPGNGGIDPGETVTVNISLKNFGSVAATNFTATLLAKGGVTYPGPAQSFDALPAGGVTNCPVTFTASGACGGLVTAWLQLQDGTNDLGPVSFSFSLGATNAVQIFAAPGFISLSDVTVAAPYPSTNLISGVTGAVSKVTVTLHNLSHTFPDDLDILLVGPGGQSVILMSDAGGSADLTSTTLTFDDSVATAIPDSTQLTSGTYRTGNYGTAGADSFPAPAPAAPWDLSLDVFNNVDPNGAWRLFVVDDAGTDIGGIAGGWSLAFTTGGGFACCQPVPAAPLIVGTTNSGGNIHFSFVTEPGAGYVVEGKDSLSDPGWQLLETIVGDGTLKTVSYPVNAPQQRFYRLRVE